MTKFSAKRTAAKTAKITGASLSLAWSVMGCAIVVFGSMITVRQKADKLALAMQS